MVKQELPLAASMSLPLVCITLEGNSVEEVLKQAELATAEGADLIEVRFDKLYVEPVRVTAQNTDGVEETSIELVPRSVDSVNVSESISQLKRAIDKPVLFTCRARSEGGNFPDDESTRISIIQQAIDSGVSWVDLELSMDSKARKKLVAAAKETGATVVSSLHNIETTPFTDEIIEMIESNSDKGDIVKLCFQTSNYDNALSIFEAAWKLRDSGQNYSIMGTGIGGDWPRIHAPLLNQKIVYSTLKKGFPLADQGLINIQDLRISWDMLGHT